MPQPRNARNLCIHALLRAAQRYHYASLQDQNPIVASRHNAYAVALIDALRDIATEGEVGRVAGVSLTQLRNSILSVQDHLEGKAFDILQNLKARGIDVGLGQENMCKVRVRSTGGKAAGKEYTYFASSSELDMLEAGQLPDRELIEVITTGCRAPAPAVEPAAAPEPEPTPEQIKPTVPTEEEAVEVSVGVPSYSPARFRRAQLPLWKREGRPQAAPVLPEEIEEAPEKPEKKDGFPWWILVPASALIL